MLKAISPDRPRSVIAWLSLSFVLLLALLQCAGCGGSFGGNTGSSFVGTYASDLKLDSNRPGTLTFAVDGSGKVTGTLEAKAIGMSAFVSRGTSTFSFGVGKFSVSGSVSGSGDLALTGDVPNAGSFTVGGHLSAVTSITVKAGAASYLASATKTGTAPPPVSGPISLTPENATGPLALTASVNLPDIKPETVLSYTWESACKFGDISDLVHTNIKDGLKFDSDSRYLSYVPNSKGKVGDIETVTVTVYKGSGASRSLLGTASAKVNRPVGGRYDFATVAPNLVYGYVGDNQVFSVAVNPGAGSPARFVWSVYGVYGKVSEWNSTSAQTTVYYGYQLGSYLLNVIAYDALGSPIGYGNATFSIIGNFQITPINPTLNAGSTQTFKAYNPSPGIPSSARYDWTLTDPNSVLRTIVSTANELPLQFSDGTTLGKYNLNVKVWDRFQGGLLIGYGLSTFNVGGNLKVTPENASFPPNTDQTFTADLGGFKAPPATSYEWTVQTGAAKSSVVLPTPSAVIKVGATLGVSTLSVRVLDSAKKVLAQGSTTFTVVGKATISPDSPTLQVNKQQKFTASIGTTPAPGSVFEWTLTGGHGSIGSATKVITDVDTINYAAGQVPGTDTLSVRVFDLKGVVAQGSTSILVQAVKFGSVFFPATTSTYVDGMTLFYRPIDFSGANRYSGGRLIFDIVHNDPSIPDQAGTAHYEFDVQAYVGAPIGLSTAPQLIGTKLKPTVNGSTNNFVGADVWDLGDRLAIVVIKGIYYPQDTQTNIDFVKNTVTNFVNHTTISVTYIKG